MNHETCAIQWLNFLEQDLEGMQQNVNTKMKLDLFRSKTNVEKCKKMAGLNTVSIILLDDA